MHPSPEPLSEAELDLLADYRENLLDPDEAARVAHLIDTDERWSAANDVLGPALTGVHARLGELASHVESMPGDVAARVDGELRALQPPVSLDAARARRRTPSATRIRLAAAALIVIALFGGAAVLIGPNLTSGGRSTSSIAAQDSAGARDNVAVTHSGMNYTFGDLSSKFAAATSSEKAVPNAAPSATQVPRPSTGGAIGPMQANASSAADRLDGCLSAVARAYAATPTAVDYGTFDGTPALIITLRDPDMVVAVDTTCGASSSVNALGIARN